MGSISRSSRELASHPLLLHLDESISSPPLLASSVRRKVLFRWKTLSILTILRSNSFPSIHLVETDLIHLSFRFLP